MKLNVPAVLVAALYGGLSNALNTHVKIADVPSHVEVGQQIRLDWSNDYDYKVKEFALYRIEDHTRKHRADVPHLWAWPEGNHSMIWSVPNVREHGGTYAIWLGGRQLLNGSNNRLVQNSSVWSNEYGRSNEFQISGGVKLFPKEIAGIVVGSIAAVALLVGLYVLGARIVRKRKSVAVDLPGPGEGGYSDVREVSPAA